MSEQDFENCLRNQYNLDAEAVEFIGHFFAAAGESGSRAVHDWMQNNPRVVAFITSLLTVYGSTDAGKKLITRVFAGVLSVEAIELLLAALAGLAFGAIVLALEAAVQCAPLRYQ